MLPIDDALPQVLTILETQTKCVLLAPPGAGKTTRVPLALLQARWRGDGKIIILAPRRLAARAAAARMAEQLGEPVGQTVGYRVRLQSKVSRATRIEVVTSGIFHAMVQNHPGLEGVAALIHDEFHERSLDGDLALALALDVQEGLRPDLRMIVMSATLDGARVAGLLGDAPIIESKGRLFPIETHYLGRDPSSRIEDQMLRAIKGALAHQEGSILAFLPGAAEIGRVARLLDAERLPDRISAHPLMGALSLDDQAKAIEPAGPGCRKIVLATSIAETSLTIEGVRIVIDSGLARRPVFEPDRGITHLVTRSASRAAAEQRRGRAGRTASGVCLRLWDKNQEGALPAFDRPEMLDADLSGLALNLASWGVRDPSAMKWLDGPPVPAWSEAVRLLTSLGALNAEGALTEHGRAIARIGTTPRLAHMIVCSQDDGASVLAAELAALLSEQGLGGFDVDLAVRLRRWHDDRSPRAQSARTLARSWLPRNAPSGAQPTDPDSLGMLIGLAFPDRLAKARKGQRGSYLLANGRGVELDTASPLAAHDWLAVAELAASSGKVRIVAAAALSEATVLARYAERLEVSDDIRFDRKSARIVSRRITKLGAIILKDQPLTAPPVQEVRAAFLEAIVQFGLSSLVTAEPFKRIRQRIDFVRRLASDPAEWPDVSDESLVATLEHWFPEMEPGIIAFDQIEDEALVSGVMSLLAWDQQRTLDHRAPTHWTSPAGARKPIDYSGPASPEVSVRVQEVYGLKAHPVVGDTAVPIRLILLSPASRSVQVTQDLPNFWQSSWLEVRREMKASYPKHDWPESPATATPSIGLRRGKQH